MKDRFRGAATLFATTLVATTLVLSAPAHAQTNPTCDAIDLQRENVFLLLDQVLEQPQSDLRDRYIDQLLFVIDELTEQLNACNEGEGPFTPPPFVCIIGPGGSCDGSPPVVVPPVVVPPLIPDLSPRELDNLRRAFEKCTVDAFLGDIGGLLTKGGELITKLTVFLVRLSQGVEAGELDLDEALLELTTFVVELVAKIPGFLLCLTNELARLSPVE